MHLLLFVWPLYFGISVSPVHTRRSSFNVFDGRVSSSSSSSFVFVTSTRDFVASVYGRVAKHHPTIHPVTLQARTKLFTKYELALKVKT